MLDARLTAVAAFVRQESVVADIGCDHGKLAVALIKEERCRRVIACDAKEKPLARAQLLAQQCGCETRVECRLGDGLNTLQPNEADDIVIAGLSGITISQILAASPFTFQQQTRFIFVPATKRAELREWLWQHGFSILTEVAVQAAGRYYPVMHVAYTGTIKEPTPFECVVGCIQNGPHTAGYLLREAGVLEKYALGVQEKETVLALALAVRRKAATCTP